MWIIINIVLIIAGAYGLYHANEINKSENVEALVSGVIGVVLLFVGVVSSGIKYFN